MGQSVLRKSKMEVPKMARVKTVLPGYGFLRGGTYHSEKEMVLEVSVMFQTNRFKRAAHMGHIRLGQSGRVLEKPDSVSFNDLPIQRTSQHFEKVKAKS